MTYHVLICEKELSPILGWEQILILKTCPGCGGGRSKCGRKNNCLRCRPLRSDCHAWWGCPLDPRPPQWKQRLREATWLPRTLRLDGSKIQTSHCCTSSTLQSTPPSPHHRKEEMGRKFCYSVISIILFSLKALTSVVNHIPNTP